MRDIVCDKSGCTLEPKMTKTTQIGAGVISDSQSYLVPLKSLKSSKSRSGSVKKRSAQVGKGKRRSKTSISVIPASGLKGRKRRCVKTKSKKPASKKTTRKNLKKSKKSRK